MVRAELRFYAELNDLLPKERRGRSFARSVPLRTSVKDAIEAVGVPHTEVDLVLRDGQSVSFSALLTEDCRLSVFPVFERLDVSSVTRVRAEPLREPRLLLDAHLGRVTKYLRILGLDAAFDERLDDGALAQVSREEKRILVTRDRELLKRTAVTHGCWIRAQTPRAQAAELIDRLDLGSRLAPLTRCLECNVPLVSVSSDSVKHAVPAAVLARHHDFTRCPACCRVYWFGSHVRRMQALVDALRHGLESTVPDPPG
jgi:uncharacterized protein with PIN domain